MVKETDQNITQVQLETFDIPLVLPAHKLDADQYSADDLDGVTESLFGSGNMAYASLQASQTDELLVTANPFAISTNDSLPADNQHAVSGRIAPELNAQSSQNSSSAGNDNDDTADTDRGFDTQNQQNAVEGNGNGNFSTSTIGSASASQSSSDTRSFAPATSGQGRQEGQDGVNGENGQTPPTPTNGIDGQNGTNGGLGDIEINLGDITIDLGDLTEFLDQTFINIGDTVSNLTTTVTEITDILGDVINNLDLSTLLDLTQITNLITNLTQNLTQTITTTVTEITDITNNVTNLLENILCKDGDLALGLHLNVVDTGILDAHIPLKNILNTDLNLDVNLAPTVDLANNIANLTGLDVLSDTLAELGGTVATLQNAIDQVTDLVSDFDLNNPGATVEQLIETIGNLDETVADITGSVDDAVGNILDNLSIGGGDNTLGGILNFDNSDQDGLISQTLDPVVGDVTDVIDDLTGGMSNDLTNTANQTLDSATNLADNLTGGLTDGLLGMNNNNANSTDSDLTAGLGLGLLTQDEIDEEIEGLLDPVEDLAGDLDLDLDGTLDLFNIDNILNTDGDSDVTLQTGLDVIDTGLLGGTSDIQLDFVEEIAGDIDIDTSIVTDVLGNAADDILNAGAGGTGEDTLLSGLGDGLNGLAETLVPGLNAGNGAENDLGLNTNIDILDEHLAGTDLGSVLDPVEDILGDIDTALNLDGDLLGNSETSNTADDSDLTLDLDADIAGNDILDLPPIDIPLDLVEEITGDIDLDITSAVDLLNNSDSGNGLGDLTEGLETSWTESVVSDVGGVLGNITSGIDTLGQSLPDPVGDVAEGLGVLQITPKLQQGLGGLFG